LTVAEALKRARERIHPLDARVLLCQAIGRAAAYVIAHPEATLDIAQERRYLELVQRRAAGEPAAYLTGEREFYGRGFVVTSAVLIPRPETELLVELALARIPPHAPTRVLDLGTGSGCIALTIASERSHAAVCGIDLSRQALDVAEENRGTLGVSNAIFRRGDWYSPVADERFDLIVSNPPYVATGDPHLAIPELRHEPPSALEAGEDGLKCIRAIVAGARPHLLPGGWLLIEHGYDQGAAVRALLEAHGYAAVFGARDLAGIERVAGGRLTLADQKQ
jgi:release factor glutamine methyltransferase